MREIGLSVQSTPCHKTKNEAIRARPKSRVRTRTKSISSGDLYTKPNSDSDSVPESHETRHLFKDYLAAMQCGGVAES